MALTFVNPVEMDYLRMIENEKQKTIRTQTAKQKEVEAARQNEVFDKITEWMANDTSSVTRDDGQADRSAC